MNKRRISELSHKIDSASENLQLHKRALSTMQDIAQKIEQVIHQKIADTVTKCIVAVFGNKYKFDIELEKKRNKTEANLVFTHCNAQLDPISSCGGGVLDVASFALRVACISLMKYDKVVILDEPFKFVSKEYRSAIRELLEQLAESLNMQIIMITHIPDICTGQIIDIEEICAAY
ncbi:MAG: hypothetical protein QXI61_05785 [Nitrososphaerota archaeon]